MTSKYTSAQIAAFDLAGIIFADLLHMDMYPSGAGRLVTHLWEVMNQSPNPITQKQLLTAIKTFRDLRLDFLKRNLVRGKQIVYLPSHVWDIQDDAVQFGFVSSGPNHMDAYFCRYWLPLQYWDDGIPVLRTVANSESTPTAYLVIYEMVDQSRIDRILETS